MIKVGSKVLCVDDNNINSKSGVKVVAGETYTIDGIREMNRGIGVSVSEIKRTIPVRLNPSGEVVRMRAYFLINRFIDITEIENEKTTSIQNPLQRH